MIGADAEIDLALDEEAAHEKSSGSEQQERQSHFADDESFAEAAAPAAGVTAAARLEGLIGISSGRGERGRKTKQERG